MPKSKHTCAEYVYTYGPTWYTMTGLRSEKRGQTNEKYTRPKHRSYQVPVRHMHNKSKRDVMDKTRLGPLGMAVECGRPPLSILMLQPRYTYARTTMVPGTCQNEYLSHQHFIATGDVQQ